jgi:hypothetical protein
MIFMYIHGSICPARYQCWLVLEMISKDSRLYMNLTGHTLKGFRIFKKLAYMIVSSASGRLLVMCPRGNHNNSDYGPQGFHPSRIRVLMGLWWGSPLACSTNIRSGARGMINTHLHATRWNPSRHLLSAELQSPIWARGASTPTRGVPSLYVRTP